MQGPEVRPPNVPNPEGLGNRSVSLGAKRADLRCALRVPRSYRSHNLHQSSLNPHGNTNLPIVIPGFQEWSAEPQIPRLALGMTKGEGRCKERAVAEPKHLSN